MDNKREPLFSAKYCDRSFTTAVQWNDLSGDDDTYTGSRGMPYTLSIGYILLSHIMNMYNIKMFIRGHQDNCPTEIGYSIDLGTHDDTCPKSIATKTSITTDPISGKIINKKWDCRTTVIKQKNMCMITYNVPGFENNMTPQSAKTRVITTSMAHEKRFAAPGAYIVIRKAESTSGGGRKRNCVKGGVNIPLKYDYAQITSCEKTRKTTLDTVPNVFHFKAKKK